LPKGKADQVSVHDFPHLGKGKAIPYGAYDIARNRAVVNVGVTWLGDKTGAVLAAMAPLVAGNFANAISGATVSSVQELSGTGTKSGRSCRAGSTR
jgi:hypothetical protein